jgi:MFS family permease
MTTALNSRLPAAPAQPARGTWVMLCLLLAGQFMGLLDVTIVNVALPTIGRSLHGSGAGLQLVVAGYTISYATLLITGARLGDIFGRRRMFLIGVLGFTAASLACGLAPTFAFLIVARLVQGAGAAAMIPQIMSVIQQRFEGQARARALGAYAAVLATGAVAGQVLGGVLVTANLLGTQWRPVFLVNVPVGLAIALAVPRVLPRDTPRAGPDISDDHLITARSGPRPAAQSYLRKLDLAGLATVVPAVFLIVTPLMLGHEEHWPAWTFASMAAGIGLAAAFVAVERRVASRGRDPLLDLHVLRSPGLASGLAAVAILMITYGGFLFSLALHLQAGLGDSALRAGLTFAPSAAAFGLCGYFWRRLPRRRHHLITPVGSLLAAVAYLGLALDLRTGTTGGPWLYLVLIVLGGSLALGFSPLVTHALAGVRPADAANASGLLTTTFQLSQAVGVATFGSLFLTLAADHARHASAHAITITFAGLAVLLGLGVLAGLPLSRLVARNFSSGSDSSGSDSSGSDSSG